MGKAINLLKKGKEGLIIGLIAGYVIGRWFLPDSLDLNAIAQTQSLIDVARTAGTTAIEFAKTKAIIGTMIIAGTIGFLVDIYDIPKKIRRKL